MESKHLFGIQLAILGLWLGATMIGACNVPEQRAKHVLEGAGYTEIEVGGHAWLACGSDDSLASEFTAIGPSGTKVSGSVCCGLIAKDCTVRAE